MFLRLEVYGNLAQNWIHLDIRFQLLQHSMDKAQVTTGTKNPAVELWLRYGSNQ